MATRKRATTRKKPARRGMRTKKGTVTSKTRKKAGMKSTGKSKKYPVFDQKSCVSAARLRHHAKGGPSASAVLAKCSRWANAHNNSACKAAVKRAREADRKRKKK